jgi:hypothetical protein
VVVDHPALRQGLDAADARGLADFHRQLLGLRWRIGDERPRQAPVSGLGSGWALWGGSGFRGFG